MDIATLIGLIAGFGVVLASMALGGGILAYVNAPGLVIVLGGTFAALFVNETLPNVLSAFRVMLKAFFVPQKPIESLVPLITNLAAKARKEGLVSLEGEEIPDEFMARGVRLGVDGLSPEVVKTTLMTELMAIKQRHQRGQKIFRFLSATAPALGMVGTLIGLVQMLRVLDDPSKIGPAMAIALLTTLYGAVLAFMLFGPIADKLENRTQEEVARKMLAIVGVESILNGDNTLVIQSRLEAFLAPKQREKVARK